jgi:uncharacterized membrane protein YeaQ/YmgE (transglycosylase-associated protein family)
MKNAILRFLVSRAGGILTPIVAGLVGAGVAKIAALDPNLAGTIDQVAVTGFVLAAIMSALNAWTNKVQADGVKQIQFDVGAKVDGIPGPNTQAKVQRIASRGNPAK